MNDLWRALTLRSAPGLLAGASEPAIAWRALVALLLWLLVDRLRAGAGQAFDGLGIPALALVALMLLAIGWVLARLTALPFRALLLALLLPLPPLLLLSLGVVLIDRPALWSIAAALLALYALLYIWRLLRGWGARRAPGALLAAAGLAAAYLWLGQQVDISPTLWASPDSSDTSDADNLPNDVAEKLLFEQRARIDAALDQVAPATEARPVIFFVGFAGVGAQKVFAQEIKLAAQVVGQRFDSSMRQVLLLNDARDLDSYPLASVVNLRYALAGIAHKMRPGRDILFLALSSHGSQDPSIEVDNGGLPLQQLGPDELAAALDHAGIARRILVISACYAGGFIEPLQDSNTILITAAASNRTSFGCSSDRDLTYFGEAFYRDALPRARSLEQAFELAKGAIAQHEASEQVEASNPQASFGADLTRLLSVRPMAAPLQSAQR